MWSSDASVVVVTRKILSLFTAATFTTLAESSTEGGELIPGKSSTLYNVTVSIHYSYLGRAVVCENVFTV